MRIFLLFRWMATPYRFSSQDPVQVRYNRAHARARNCIEQIFGFVKNKFRILLTGIRLKNMVKAAKMIQCIFALWNFILDHEGPPRDEDIDPNADVTVREDQLSDSMEDNSVQIPRNSRQRQKTKDVLARKYFQ